MEIQDSAFLIHRRPLSDSRVILEFFTRYHGRISGVYRLGKNRLKSHAPQQFMPLSLHWFGKNELKTLAQVEPEGASLNLQGEALYCGMYLNELSHRMLAPEDSHPDLFVQYLVSLNKLKDCVSTKDIQPILREFELLALQVLGYGLDFEHDINGEVLSQSETAFYHFIVGEGFAPAALGIKKAAFSGRILRDIYQKKWAQPNVLVSIKSICREAIRAHIGDKPLKSREFFLSLGRQE